MNDNINRCRACLKEYEHFSYYLFDNASAKTFSFCTSIDISPEEKLTKALCNDCYDLLKKFADFKYTCLQSHETLLSLCHIEHEHFKFDKKHLRSTKQALSSQRYCDEESDLLTEVKLEDYNLCIDDEPLVSEYNFEEITNVDKRKAQKRLKKVKRPKIKGAIKRHFAFKCKICSKKFNHLDRFEAHKLLHEGINTSINCVPCKKTFMTWSGLRRHKESCHLKVDLSAVKCSICGKVCKSRQTLRVHMRLHGERKTSICNVCGKDFTSEVVLKNHLETHKNNREREYTCEHCGNKFFTNAILRAHISRCHTDKRYICDVCSCPFTDKYNLSKHLLIHEGKHLIYNCDTCKKSYSCHSSLIEHKRIHSGERPFSCRFCSKKFITKRRLTEHHRIHTGERPHRCEVCTQAFTQRGTLNRHMKIHNKQVQSTIQKGSIVIGG